MTKEEEKELINLWVHKTENQKLYHDTGGEVENMFQLNNVMIVETDMWNRMPIELLELNNFYWVNITKTKSKVYNSCITIEAAHKTLIDFQVIIKKLQKKYKKLITNYDITYKCDTVELIIDNNDPLTPDESFRIPTTEFLETINN